MAKHKKKPAPEAFWGLRPVRETGWLLAPLALWGAVVLWAYYRHAGVPFLHPSFWLRYLPPVWEMPASVLGRHLFYAARLAVFLTLAAALGRGLLKRVFRVEGLNELETFAFGCGLGLGTVGLGTFLLGACRLLVPWAVCLWAAALTAAAAVLNRDLLRGRTRDPQQPPLRALLREPGSLPLAALALLILAYGLYRGLAPVISFDSLVYHLSLPHLYRLEGGLVATPTNMYSGIPMLMEWVYAFLLFFGDGIAAKLSHWGCGLAIAAAFLGLGLRARRPLVGWLAVLIFLSSPVVLYNIVRPGVDVGSSLMVLLAVYSLALWVRREPEDRPEGLLMLSAALTGLAMGFKYTNWPLLPVLAAVLWAMKAGRRAVVRFALVAAALAAPWAIKNLVLYSNPLFPFFHDVIAPHSAFPAPWRALRTDAWGRDWSVILKDGRKLLEVLLHPWFISVRGGTEFDHVGPLFLIALPALLWLRPSSRESRLWMWSVFGLWMAWWPFTGMPRFFLPGLCLLSPYAASVFLQERRRWLRYALLLLVAGVCLDHATIYTAITHTADSHMVLVRGMSKEDYLRHTRRSYVASYYKTGEWIGENLPEDARLLLLGGGRGYYIPRPFRASTTLDTDILTHRLKQSPTGDALYRKLREAGFSHVMANMAWIWRTMPDPTLTPENYRVLEDFLRRHLRLIHRDEDVREPRWVLVYELVDDAGPGPGWSSPILDWYLRAREIKARIDSGKAAGG